LESANFAAQRVRRGARSLGMSSEASRRFERGVDPNGVRRALDRAAALLLQHANGTLRGAAIEVVARPVLPAKVTLRVARCNAILG
jgi:phenylalanyl-tRNA synthetase beta chain